MILEKALFELNNKENTRDILEMLWINFRSDYFSQDYYNNKVGLLPKWDYFISDLDWTFFRWVLQKEAVSLFIKFVRKQDYLNLDIDEYHWFLIDVKFFNNLEKKAYNKEIEYSEYLNAGIYLLIKHKSLIDWDDYLSYIKYNFKIKEKINPFIFSLKKMKEVLVSGNNFLFVSWAPDFIFEIYLNLLKTYISKDIWDELSEKIFWFGSYLSAINNDYIPLWGKDHKNNFITWLKKQNVINDVIWWMWDTFSDFWISHSLSNDKEFYFINPEKKVIDEYNVFKKEWVNYHLLIERKNLIIELKKEDIKFI